jgi:hypothetical protein
MKMTIRRAEIVRALKDGPAKYLMIRPMATVPAHRRSTLLSGAKLVELVDGEAREPEGVPSPSAMAARGMIEAGYLVEVKQGDLRWGHLYVLSESGKALDLQNAPADRVGWDCDQGPRIFRSDIEAIAAEYGASVLLNNTRHWWELAIPGTEARKRRVMLTTTKNQPIAKLGDLSLKGWREVIERVAGQNGLTKTTD